MWCYFLDETGNKGISKKIELDSYFVIRKTLTL